MIDKKKHFEWGMMIFVLVAAVSFPWCWLILEPETGFYVPFLLGETAVIFAAGAREYTQAGNSMKWSKENVKDFLWTIALPTLITLGVMGVKIYFTARL